MAEAALTETEVEAIRLDVAEATATAAALAIVDEAGYETAAVCLSGVRERRDRIEETFKPLKQAAQAAHKRIVQEEARFLKPVLAAEKAIREAMGSYAARVEEEQRLAAAAAARAAAEAERARREAEAAALIDEGRTTEALALVEAPIAPPVAKIERPSAPGTGTREAWSAEVDDLLALVKWVAANPDTGLALLLPNGPALNALAKQLKKVHLLPGVRGVRGVAISSRR